MKGLIFGTPHYDFSGCITIREISKNDGCAKIEFYEEGKKIKSPGFFEGKILDSQNEIKYLIKGRWDQELYITKKDGSEKKEIWKINQDEALKNTDFINNYLMSEYACNLNYLPEESEVINDKYLIKFEKLGNILPCTDSRLRKDQRLLEMRSVACRLMPI